MFRKCLIFIVFLSLMSMNLAQENEYNLLPLRPTKQNATKCFTCYTPESCRRPAAVTCDQRAADEMRSVLSTHFQNVASLLNEKFECTKISYKFRHNVVFAVSGCVNVGLSPCNLQPKNASYRTQVCVSCNKNLCNPAATFSSSFAIMMSCIFVLMFLKF